MEYDKYFEYRNTKVNHNNFYRLPVYIKNVLPKSHDCAILDIGCGPGQMIRGLKEYGYKNVSGIDISKEAVSICLENNLNVQQINNIEEFCRDFREQKYDFIIMSHVLEHILKNDTIETLKLIKSKLLRNGGSLLVMVPNAQSNTDCYWAYEDFTHQTIYTAGSLYYVLKSADFESVEFLDVDCTEDLSLIKRIIRRLFLIYYRKQKNFWNRITSSAYHQPSLQIFSFEIKALAQ